MRVSSPLHLAQSLPMISPHYRCELNLRNLQMRRRFTCKRNSFPKISRVAEKNDICKWMRLEYT
jgi:hypothetical protein